MSSKFCPVVLLVFLVCADGLRTLRQPGTADVTTPVAAETPPATVLLGSANLSQPLGAGEGIVASTRTLEPWVGPPRGQWERMVAEIPEDNQTIGAAGPSATPEELASSAPAAPTPHRKWRPPPKPHPAQCAPERGAFWSFELEADPPHQQLLQLREELRPTEVQRVELLEANYSFVRNCPRKGDSFLDWQPLLIPHLKLAFCYIPKVACTEFKDLFNILNGGGLRTVGFGHHYHRSMANSLGISMDNVTKENGWKFAAFTRDPALRYISAFGSTCVSNKKGKYEHTHTCCGRLVPGTSPPEEMLRRFEERVEYDSEHGLAAEDGHWVEQTELLKHCSWRKFKPEKLDFWGHLSGDVNAQVKQMFHMVNYTNELLIDHFFPVNGSTEGHHNGLLHEMLWKDFYRNATILKKVKKLFEDDYKRLPGVGCSFTDFMLNGTLPLANGTHLVLNVSMNVTPTPDSSSLVVNVSTNTMPTPQSSSALVNKSEPVSNSIGADLDATTARASGSTEAAEAAVSFRWSEYGDKILTDINIDLKTGKSLAVIGATGSGKTTLLHAILGELYPVDDACVEVPMTMSYSAQVPYICEGTLRENVLFGEPINEEHYKTAIHAACLLPDLEMLPGGEEVPIGSRGISLSGGQKARVSMARASYHSQRGGLVLLDDPFGAVDSRTARHLLDHLIHGRGLEGRTRIVVTQPDPERIARFDEVVVLSKGKIVARGTPGEVMETELYQALLNSHQIEALKTMGEGDAMAPVDGTGRGDETTKGKKAPEVFQLREEEFQGRIDWKTMHYFCSTGKWSMIVGCVSLYFCQQVCYLMMNVSLQHWSTDQMLYSAGVGHDAPRPVIYMWGYIAWFVASNLVWIVCWGCGVWFTLRMSSLVFKSVLAGLMHAPTDRFFDRTPVGRIMNRLSSDLANLDNNTYNQITILIGLCWQTMVPISYIHILMPLYFTVLTIPVYYLIFSLIRRYWNTMVPMRYLTHVSKSSTDDILTEVQHSNISVRAMQKADFRLGVFQSLLSNQMKADITTTLVLQRWLVNRLFLLLGFFITILVLVAVWVPHVISFGGIGLALSNCFQVVTGIEQYISSAAAAQFQFISLNRLYEYTKLPQERPNVLASDGKYKSFAVMIPADVVGKLVPKHEEGVVKLYRQNKNGHEELVLVQDPASQTFAAPPHKNLSVLGKKVDNLEDTTAWHRITSVHGARGDIMKMADKLCNPTSEGVYIEVQTGWLTEGAEVVIEDLRAGYGDIPRDVLKEVNLIVDPRSKAGIVGTTGCGKSTLLLTLLRILEPREGRIMINGVNTASLGLQTLRQAVGLVPQDPVLLQTSVRENLDPFWTHSDEDIWKGLAMVQLAETVKQMEFGIWSPIAADGGNLSFGQRQLLCLARTVIRQPSLILLDEATSALDPATQELVQKTIESSFPLSTIIVIAHRLETILNFDLIIVMEQGSIAEKGSPTDLAQVKGGIFAKMLAAKRTW